MTEHRLFDGPTAHVSTPEFHRDRNRGAHLEDPGHRPRLFHAAGMVASAAMMVGPDATVSDLGCGDGGLLSLIGELVPNAWGYDFAPANAAGWAERGVNGRYADVFGADRDAVELGNVVVMTEVLEHLSDPHGVVAWVASPGRFLVASSPWGETPASHDECHAWAWDRDGYRDLIEGGGFQILRHENVGPFQVVMARCP